MHTLYTNILYQLCVSVQEENYPKPHELSGLSSKQTKKRERKL